MNEELIKDIIKYKLTAANKILNHFPKKLSDNIKTAGRIILKEINESSQEIKDQPVNRSKSTDKVNNIDIE